ncbi:5-methylcytosine restriction system specificity protein McrC [Pannonibacter carbonis]|uniref:5-methylcytosine restriction system specificity protein McrC n=1 Tax=Pannonibacter carbonis TaxID=2067569 RepID=UPI000D0F67FC|nr:restriction endonuclease [Pannonibacter carbonis]
MSSEGLAPLARLMADRGFGASLRTGRQIIAASEQETIILPTELLKPDGALDVYDDIMTLFRPTYHKNRPAIQCGGWIGYIPLNDAFALEVASRVPIGNLERLVGMAAGYTPNILRRHARQFAQADGQPASLVEILSDQLLTSFDRICELGLLKAYTREKRLSSFPVGRIYPFESAWRAEKLGKPVAVSSSFQRTSDCGANRVLRYAFEKLLARYIGTTEDRQRPRLQKLKRAVDRLEAISTPAKAELTPSAIAGIIGHLPRERQDYADAMMIAQLIIFDASLSIRGTGEVALLPSLLIDMSKVFEDYARRVLSDGFQNDDRVAIKDGNRGGEQGAKAMLFDPIQPGLKNPTVTPDIVIEIDSATSIIIDAKYKGAPKIPDRNDINQVVLYGAKYGAQHVMLLHAGRPNGRSHVELCGKVGDFSVYNGMIDLDASVIEEEEAGFVKAIASILGSPD